MRTPCIKVVSEGRYGSLQSFTTVYFFSQVYRETDGTINTVKSSFVFTEPDDAALFIRNCCPALLMNQVWIASADTIEPRSWVFAYDFLNDLHDHGDDPAVIRMRELALQCCNRTERPEDLQEMIGAFDDVKETLGYWMSRIPVVDAPKGTALAINLKLEKRIDFHKKGLPFKKTGERIAKDIPVLPSLKCSASRWGV